MAEEVAEVTESLPKETGLVGLDGPLDELDLTKMLAESFEPEEQDRSDETSPSGDAVEEAEPVEAEMNYAEYISRDDFYDNCTTMTGHDGKPFWLLNASKLNKGLIPIL